MDRVPEANALYAKTGILGCRELIGGPRSVGLTKLGSLPLLFQLEKNGCMALILIYCRLVEIWSGIPGRIFLSCIFKPLGMKDFLIYPLQKLPLFSKLFEQAPVVVKLKTRQSFRWSSRYVISNETYHIF